METRFKQILIVLIEISVVMCYLTFRAGPIWFIPTMVLSLIGLFIYLIRFKIRYQLKIANILNLQSNTWNELKTNLTSFYKNPSKEEGFLYCTQLSQLAKISERYGLYAYSSTYDRIIIKIQGILEEIRKMEGKLTTVRELLNENHIYHAQDLLQKIAISINNMESQTLQKICENFGIEAKEKEQTMFQEIRKKITTFEGALEKKKFIEATNFLTLAEKDYRRVTSDSSRIPQEKFEFHEMTTSLDTAREYHMILKLLIDMAKQFPRIHLNEVEAKIPLESGNIEGLLKQLIDNGEIKAEYDPISKGITFNYLTEEIDDLIANFSQWENKDSFKKK